MGLFKRKKSFKNKQAYKDMTNEESCASLKDEDFSHNAPEMAPTVSQSLDDPASPMDQSTTDVEYTYTPKFSNSNHGPGPAGQDTDWNDSSFDETATYDDNATDYTREASMEDLPSLIDDLATCDSTFSERPARALRMLFSLSEHNSLHEINRIRMIREAHGQLVPVLLQFLSRCRPTSSEQVLALLVLNNVSIPSENKRLVAIEYKGGNVLSRMLCQDPSCSLICIILVNLSFSDSVLRNQLVEAKEEIELVEALAYALKIAILPDGTPLPTGMENKSPRQLLLDLLEEDQSQSPKFGTPFNSHNLSLAETARWCLCGMKNLTRPSKDPIASHCLIKCGVLPIILKILSVGSATTRQSSIDFNVSTSEDYKGLNVMPEVPPNDPYTWDSNSIQDAALYILLNLAIHPSTRSYLRQENAANTISLVARYSSSPISPSSGNDEEKQKNLQCLKARMTLAYLFGSEGHFGQAVGPVLLQNESADLLIKGAEAPLLVELLANTLHGRGKEGPGGYSATTFNCKKVLFAIRCLLTNKLNVKTFDFTCGVKFNALLFKAISLHSIQELPIVDIEAAEDACFSLYLMSHYGFTGPFLPKDGYPFEKVLKWYYHKDSCTEAGRHAAKQLLLRSSYLDLDGSICEDDEPSRVPNSDYELGKALLHAAESLSIQEHPSGAEPLDDIFGRPIRRKIIDDGGGGGNDEYESFPSALDASTNFSFGFTKTSALDDVYVANNLAICASGGQAQSYGFEWKWEDFEDESIVQERLNNFKAGRLTSIRGMINNVRDRNSRTSEPFSFLGYCGCNATDAAMID